MDAFLRKCRGMLGIGATWSAAWAAIFAALATIIGIIDPGSIGAAASVAVAKRAELGASSEPPKLLR